MVETSACYLFFYVFAIAINLRVSSISVSRIVLNQILYFELMLFGIVYATRLSPIVCSKQLPLAPFLFGHGSYFFFLEFGCLQSFSFGLLVVLSLSMAHFKEKWWAYIPAFFFCSRLFAVIGDYRVYTRDPMRIFILTDGGFSYLGGMVGIAIVLYWVIRDHRSTFLQWLDVLLPATTFGLVFDWIGKFSSGHAYGVPTNLFWGISYDAMNVRYTVPLQPVQIYYALFFFILTFALLVIRRYSNRAGAETLWGIFIATLGTMLLENLRGDFSIPIFATHIDFIVLITLFISLGVFAAIELSLSEMGMYLYTGMLVLCIATYLYVRSWLQYPTFELRFSQFLSVLVLLSTIVYVVVL